MRAVETVEREIEDIEVMTPHYRGAHAAAKVSAGFTRYSAVGARLSGCVRLARVRGVVARAPGRGDAVVTFDERVKAVQALAASPSARPVSW